MADIKTAQARCFSLRVPLLVERSITDVTGDSGRACILVWRLLCDFKNRTLGIDDGADLSAAGAAVGTRVYGLSDGNNSRAALRCCSRNLISADTETGAHDASSILNAATGTPGQRRQAAAARTVAIGEFIDGPISRDRNWLRREVERGHELIAGIARIATAPRICITVGQRLDVMMPRGQ